MPLSIQDTPCDEDFLDFPYLKDVQVERERPHKSTRYDVHNFYGQGGDLGCPYIHHVKGRLSREWEWPKAEVSSPRPWVPIFTKLWAKPDNVVESPTEIARILLEITQLTFEQEEDQFGQVRPSYSAFKNCLKLMLELVGEGGLIRPSDILTDNNGDIRISWARGDRLAELVLPFDGTPYLYHSSKEVYGTSEGDLTTNIISAQLRWVMGG